MDNTLKSQDSPPLPLPPEILLERLEALGVAYTLHHHAPIFTVAESEHLKISIPGLHCRNLFLRDNKGVMFLVTAANETRIDLKKLPDLLGCGRLSFGSPERLFTYLGIRPGSVNPFCILNDGAGAVRFILDAAMMKAEIVNYHPMDNSMTISISPADLYKIAQASAHVAEVMDFTPARPD